jgi:amino acid transporter
MKIPNALRVAILGVVLTVVSLAVIFLVGFHIIPAHTILADCAGFDFVGGLVMIIGGFIIYFRRPHGYS